MQYPGAVGRRAKKEGTTLQVVPFSSEMYGWREGQWPLGGSFRPKIISLLQTMVLEEGDPNWDQAYTKECQKVWGKCAQKSKPPPTKCETAPKSAPPGKSEPPDKTFS